MVEGFMHIYISIQRSYGNLLLFNFFYNYIRERLHQFPFTRINFNLVIQLLLPYLVHSDKIFMASFFFIAA